MPVRQPTARRYLYDSTSRLPSQARSCVAPPVPRASTRLGQCCLSLLSPGPTPRHRCEPSVNRRCHSCRYCRVSSGHVICDCANQSLACVAQVNCNAWRCAWLHHRVWSVASRQGIPLPNAASRLRRRHSRSGLCDSSALRHTCRIMRRRDRARPLHTRPCEGGLLCLLHSDAQR